MSVTTDARHFFETDLLRTETRRTLVDHLASSAQAKRAARDVKSTNRLGNPINLKAKLLAATPDPRAPSTSILVSEATGTVRSLQLDDPRLDRGCEYRGPVAPVACVAVGGPYPPEKCYPGVLFGGSWDKTIWSWDLDSRMPRRRYTGHTDFVKALVCARIGAKYVLISGGSDKKIMVWDVVSGARLHTIQDMVVNMMAVQDLVVDPLESNDEAVIVLSASSDPHIRRWKIQLDWWEQLADGSPDMPVVGRRTILEHETTVYKLVFDHTVDEVDLWSSSGDGTAKVLSRPKGFVADDTFEHGDHVRAVAVTANWVITAGRDECVKFWDRASGKLYASLEGHYDEITDLLVLDPTSSGERVCTVSLDGTVRTWPVQRAGLDIAIREQGESARVDAEDGVTDTGGDLLTLDEEAELAALMEAD